MSKLDMIEKIEKYAYENKIPIMQKDGILYLCNYIKENKIKRILEVGSAIGYSSIMMSLVSNDIFITTLEKDKDRYEVALNNIKLFGLDNQIDIKNVDAKEYFDNNFYDLIFIDASKSNNRLFFEKFSSNLDKDGVIITDNLSFHGLLEDDSLIKTKNQRSIVNKIKSYIFFLDNNKDFKTTYVLVGDKISISRKID